jgi:hypothetical protein
MTSLCLTVAAAASLPSADAVETAAPPKARLRNIVRRSLPENAKVIGLEFSVLKIQADGTQTAVDPEEHSFQVGDSILVSIKPQDDLYVYVFTEGPDGTRACLLPESTDAPPLVKAGIEISLPDDGDLFTFEPPAGDEKLVVVALKQPNPDLAFVEQAAFRAPGQKVVSGAEQDQLERGTTAMNGVRERSMKGVRMRGSVSKLKAAIESLDSASEAAQFIAPPDAETQSTEVIRVNAPEIIVDIPLRSRKAN